MEPVPAAAHGNRMFAYCAQIRAERHVRECLGWVDGVC